MVYGSLLLAVALLRSLGIARILPRGDDGRSGGLWFNVRDRKSDLARQSARQIGEVKVGKGGERWSYGWADCVLQLWPFLSDFLMREATPTLRVTVDGRNFAS